MRVVYKVRIKLHLFSIAFGCSFDLTGISRLTRKKIIPNMLFTDAIWKRRVLNLKKIDLGRNRAGYYY